ncbi:MAG: hypothetical protein HC861_09735 [Rhodospirillaceae bacterium]|nr:hypothetical protein [Rhodospirillaceae bacterium]
MTDGMSQATLIAAIPQLFVSDIATSCAFFSGKLGFKVEFVHGEPPFYAQVQRGGVQIALRHVDRDAMDKIAVAMKADVDMLAASVSVDDVQALHAEFQAAHVAFHQELRKQEWGRAPSSSAIRTATCCCLQAARVSGFAVCPWWATLAPSQPRRRQAAVQFSPPSGYR